MSRILKRNTLLVLILFICIGVVGSISTISMIANANNSTKESNTVKVTTQEGVEFSYEDFSSTVEVGSKFILPIATATFGGSSKTATTSITFPNGKSSYQSTVELSSAGKYFISWYVNFNGTLYKHVQPLNVVYGNYTLFECDQNSKIEVNYSNGQDSGVLLSSKKNGKLKYSLPVDLSTFGAGSSLIEFKVLASNAGVADFTKLIIKFSQVGNPENYFIINFADGELNGAPITYVKAGATGQSLCGLNNGTIDFSSLGGAPISTDFRGKSTSNFEVYYDNKQLELFVSNGAYGDSIALISSFADANFYSEKGVWKGFSNSEVEVSFSFEGQTGANAEILLISIGGKSLCGDVFDITPPSISIDFGEYSIDDVPIGYVGAPYPIFSATAYDKNDASECEVAFKVYKDYAKSTMRYCKEDTYNKTFIPSESGDYTIRYESKDSAGNVAVRLVNFKVEQYYPAPQLNLGFDFPSQLNPGESIDLSKFTISGGSGKVKTSIQLIYGSEKSEIEGIFTPGKPGDYVVRYTMVDFSNTTERVDFNLTVLDVTKPIFISLLKIPEQVLNGYTIDTSFVKAIYYDAQNEEVKEANVTAKLEYGNSVRQISGEYAVDVNKNEDVIKIIFTATNPQTGETSEKEYSIKVIKLYDEDELLRLERLFITENVDEIERYSDKLTFVANSNTSSESKITVINSLVANGFSISLRFTAEDAERINYTDLRITLTDSNDESIAVDLYITKRTSAYTTSYFGINKKDSVEISSSFFGNYAKDFVVKYSASANEIIDGNTARTLGVITKTKYGEDFVGFTSNKVKVSIEMLGITGVSAVSLKILGNQPITATSGDFISPQLILLGEINNYAVQGDQIYVPSAVSTDVIAGDCTPYVTVTAPDRTKIFDNVKITEGFTFTATQHGVYNIVYTSSDGNESSYSSHVITVRSVKTPHLSVSGEFKQGEVGKKYQLSSAEVSNVDGEYVLYTIIISPTGKMEVASDGYFVPKTAGKYVVRYYLRDNYYNFVYKDFTVTVK